MATRTYTALFNLKANSKREIRSSPTSFPRPDLPTFIQTYSAGKSCSAVQAYIAKGGNYIDWGTFQLDGRNKSFGDEMSDVYIAAFATRDKGKALEVIQKSNPKGYYLNLDKLSHNFDKHFKKPAQLY